MLGMLLTGSFLYYLTYMEYLNNNASKTYKPELDHSQKIKDMKLSEISMKTPVLSIIKLDSCPEPPHTIVLLTPFKSNG